MKFIAFGDSHLRDTGSFPAFNVVEENGFTRELNNILLGFQFVAMQIIKVKPRGVFFLGDLFHHKEGVTGTVLHACATALTTVVTACKRTKCKLYMIPGNHDTYSDLLGINHLSIIGGDDDYEVIHDERNFTIDGINIGVVQFNSDKSKVVESLKKACKESDLIITHLDVEGVTYETGVPSHSVIPSTWPIPILSGDIHYAQDVNSFHYAGSLVQNRFNRSDLDGAGGVLIYDTETKEIERRRNNKSKHYVKVESLDQLRAISHNEAIFQIRCEVGENELDELAKIGYEFVYIPFLDRKGSTQEQTPIIEGIDSPEKTLRSHFAKVKPEVLETFDRIMGV